MEIEVNNLRQAAKQALEALEKPIFEDFMQWALAMRNAREALKQALAEPEPLLLNGGRLTQYPDGRIGFGTRESVGAIGHAPTPRKPLTDEEIDRVTDQQWAQNNHKPIYAAHRAYARAVIAAYEAKNSAAGEGA